MPQTKILIIGGGIAGPALATLLRQDAEITLIDKLPDWNDPGYLISLSESGRRILQELEIADEVTRDGVEVSEISFCDKEGKKIRRITFDPFEKYGPFTVVPRHHLHSALAKQMEGKINVRLNVGIDELEEDEGGVMVKFTDGTNDRFDLVVGADGIKSKVRDLIFGKDHVKFLGWTLWLLWLPKDIHVPKGVSILSAKGHCAMIHPGKNQTLVTLGAKMPPDSHGQTQNEQGLLRRIFHDFHPAILKAIDNTPHPQQIFRFDMRNIVMDKWYKGRVVLIGDAQHGIPPLTGMGSSMALEDAFTLAKELIFYGHRDIEAALKAYAKKREKRMRGVRVVTHVIEKWMVLSPLLISPFRKIVIRLIPQWYITRLMEKILKEEI